MGIKGGQIFFRLCFKKICPLYFQNRYQVPGFIFRAGHAARWMQFFPFFFASFMAESALLRNVVISSGEI